MSAFRLVAAAAGLCAMAVAAEAQTPPPDLVYSRITPCRVFDTTKTSKISANGSRNFLISGGGNFASQGGATAGCGVPAAAQAVSINLTAINGAAAGSVTAAPYTQTTSSMTLRYPVSAPETAGGIVDLAQNRITLKTTNTVNAIGDVTGYYAPAIRGEIDLNGTIKTTTGRITRVDFDAFVPGRYFLYFDRNLAGCSVNVTSVSPYQNAAAYLDPAYVGVYIMDTKIQAFQNGAFYFDVGC